MRPAPHRDEIHFPPELGLDQWPHDNVRAVADRIFRHEGKAETRRSHGDDPVVALASIDAFHPGTLARENVACDLGLLAIDAVEIALTVEVAHADGIFRGEPVLPPEHNEEPFAKERKI